MMKSVLRASWHLLPMSLRRAIMQSIELGHAHAMNIVDRLAARYYRIKTDLVQHDADYGPNQLISDGFINIPSPFMNLLAIRRKLALSPSDVFIDLGCGTGRAVFVFGRAGIEASRGVEYNDLAYQHCISSAKTFLSRSAKIEFYRGDVKEFVFTNETIIFMFNPFGARTLYAVSENLRKSLERSPRRVRIVYGNPVFGDVLSSLSWLKKTDEVRHFKKQYLIFENVS